MNRREMALKTGIAGLLFSLTKPKPAKAQGGGGRSLEGALRVQVTNGPGAPPGLPAQWETLITYAAGGTVLEHNGAPGLTPAHGVWKYSGRNEFEGAWFRFVYDAQGGIQFVNKVRGCIRMTSDNDYTNEVKVDLYGPTGQLMASWPNSSVGHRIVVEPMD